MKPDYQQVAQKLDEIEAELKRIGRWDATPLPEEKFVNMGAFGMKTMSPEQWLQFVLIPRVRHIIAENDIFPSTSSISAFFTRVMDGDAEVEPLLNLLREFDGFFMPSWTQR